MHIANKENYKRFDVKFLISNEDNIDWEKLSAVKERNFSVPEIKMFGKKISWNVYIINHQMEEKSLMAAAKYLTDYNFELLSMFSNLPEEFIREYAKKLDWYSIFSNSKLDEDFIFEMGEHWSNLDEYKIKAAFINNSSINLDSKKYEKLALYLKLKEKY
jgi:hypothetical protein